MNKKFTDIAAVGFALAMLERVRIERRRHHRRDTAAGTAAAAPAAGDGRWLGDTGTAGGGAAGD